MAVVEASASSTPIISTNVSKPFPIKQLEKEDESMEAAPVVVEEPTLDKEDDEDMNVAPLDEEESIPKTTNSDSVSETSDQQRTTTTTTTFKTYASWWL